MYFVSRPLKTTEIAKTIDATALSPDQDTSAICLGDDLNGARSTDETSGLETNVRKSIIIH